MISEIKKLAEKYFSEVVGFRRHLHSYPELSFQEKETAEYIISVLNKNGIESESGWGGYGVVVNMIIDPTFETIALRGDIDALPIKEENEVSYKSKNEGVMHACGHDVHTASLLGTTLILNDLKHLYVVISE